MTTAAHLRPAPPRCSRRAIGLRASLYLLRSGKPTDAARAAGAVHCPLGRRRFRACPDTRPQRLDAETHVARYRRRVRTTEVRWAAWASASPAREIDLK